MTVNQLSVFVENKQGRLSEITAILQGAKVDIRALSIADTTHFGILRLIVDKPQAAEAALKEAGLTVSLTPVIAVGIADRPGGLAEAMATLRDGGVSVEYMYAFLGGKGVDHAYMIFRVEDAAAASAALAQRGIKVIDQGEIEKL